MRPAKERQGAIRSPLNEILGAEANVRLLRRLVSASRPMTPADLARDTGLDRTGVYRALDRLFDTGIIEYSGKDRARQCRLRADHPLAGAIRDLFGAEARRFEAIKEGVRAAVEALEPQPLSAWIEGAAARGRERFGDPLVVGVLDSPREVDEHVEALESGLVSVQREQDVTIEIRARTRADLDTLSDEERQQLADAFLLFGTPIQALVAPERYRRAVVPQTHRDLDERGLAYARAIAERLAHEPEWIDRARDWVEGRLSTASKGEARELREWMRILSSSTPARLRQLLVHEGERVTRLRQSNPFLAVLTEEERSRVRREGSYDDPGA